MGVVAVTTAPEERQTKPEPGQTACVQKDGDLQQQNQTPKLEMGFPLPSATTRRFHIAQTYLHV